MTRSYFILLDRVPKPGELNWTSVPTLLTISDLWDAARTTHAGLLFRVRSDKSPGDDLGTGDRIESCAGLIDPSSRWRAVAALARLGLNSLQFAPLAQACWQAYGMISTKHPASIAPGERMAVVGEIRAAMDKIPEDAGPQGHHEAGVGAMMIRLTHCDSDLEAVMVVPNRAGMMINVDPTNEGGVQERMASIDIEASAFMLCEAKGRLSEKAPGWLYAPMPALPQASAVSPEAAPPESSRADEDED